ncbi:MAG: outer membrane beta-barrel protein [Desulfocapsa sp.]|nr:outer membrane beta-barrel protein [Desulfocapsa sp.]
MKYRYHSILLALLLSQPLHANAANPYNLNIDTMAIVAQNEPPPLSYDDTIITYDEDAETKIEKYFHPTLVLSGEYTDNLYNVDHDTTENLLLSITPGFWLTMGQAEDMPAAVSVRNTSASGIMMAPLRTDGYDWLNATLMGSMKFDWYSEESVNDFIGGDLNASLQYKPGNKLTLYITDQYRRARIGFDIGNDTADDDRWFDSNLLYTGFDWDLTDKFSAGAKYSGFLLSNNDTVDEYMDRTDHSLSAFGAFNYSMKTSFFLQYQYITLDYDSAEYQDNEQHHIYGGVHWISTEKLTFDLKAGYQQRDYKDERIETTFNSDDNSTVALELSSLYQFSMKTGVSLALSHKFEESDSSLALGKTVFAGDFTYHQELTERLQGILALGYENADYNQMVDQPREDDLFEIRPSLQYTFREWLMTELAYSYRERDSTDDLFDYKTNTVYLSLNSAF